MTADNIAKSFCFSKNPEKLREEWYVRLVPKRQPGNGVARKALL